MNAKPQIIFDKGHPAFVVIPYSDYLELTMEHRDVALTDDNEIVPFVLSDYIKNPIRVARIDAGVSQSELADLLGVTHGYVSKIESRGYNVGDKLLVRVKAALHNQTELTG